VWPFKRVQKTGFESWPIVRTTPVGKTYGRSISLFINNGDCHLTTVDVYADGAVDCWGFVDLALFRDKLRAKWVVPAPKANQGLSVHNFGYTDLEDSVWWQTARRIEEEVKSIVHALNPEMKDLIDMHGSDVEVRGRVRYAKLGGSDKKPYRKVGAAVEEMLGDSVPVLRIAGDAFELTRLIVYADGMCQIGSDQKLVSIGELHSLYEERLICNMAPAGSRVILAGLGEFRATTDFGFVTNHDRIMEVHDMLNVLNGKPSVVRTCASLFRDYESEPSQQAKEALLHAYEAVPDHLRCYCGDMDRRDTAIRAVLYGEDSRAADEP
jgi:hypothetical protein